MARNDALSGHPTAGTGGDYDQFLTIVEPQADLGKEAAELAAQRRVRAVFTASAGGNALSHGAATRMSLDEFVRLVAEREGVTPDEACTWPARSPGGPWRSGSP